jgi:hypothetical protein
MKRNVAQTRLIGLFLLNAVLLTACEKNNASKIPHIGLTSFGPESTMRVIVDTCFIQFTIVDGDGDLANDSISGIYLKDSRYESAGFIKTAFPFIDPTIEDPKKGLEGNCTFFPVPQPEPRLDSIHMTIGDTIVYEFYIMDRAHHESNHIVLHPIIVKA